MRLVYGACLPIYKYRTCYFFLLPEKIVSCGVGLLSSVVVSFIHYPVHCRCIPVCLGCLCHCNTLIWVVLAVCVFPPVLLKSCLRLKMMEESYSVGGVCLLHLVPLNTRIHCLPDYNSTPHLDSELAMDALEIFRLATATRNVTKPGIAAASSTGVEAGAGRVASPRSRCTSTSKQTQSSRRAALLSAIVKTLRESPLSDAYASPDHLLEAVLTTQNGITHFPRCAKHIKQSENSDRLWDNTKEFIGRLGTAQRNPAMTVLLAGLKDIKSVAQRMGVSVSDLNRSRKAREKKTAMNALIFNLARTPNTGTKTVSTKTLPHIPREEISALESLIEDGTIEHAIYSRSGVSDDTYYYRGSKLLLYDQYVGSHEKAREGTVSPPLHLLVLQRINRDHPELLESATHAKPRTRFQNSLLAAREWTITGCVPATGPPTGGYHSRASPTFWKMIAGMSLHLRVDTAPHLCPICTSETSVDELGEKIAQLERQAVTTTEKIQKLKIEHAPSDEVKEASSRLKGIQKLLTQAHRTLLKLGRHKEALNVQRAFVRHQEYSCSPEEAVVYGDFVAFYDLSGAKISGQ